MIRAALRDGRLLAQEVVICRTNRESALPFVSVAWCHVCNTAGCPRSSSVLFASTSDFHRGGSALRLYLSGCICFAFLSTHFSFSGCVQATIFCCSTAFHAAIQVLVLALSLAG